MLLKVIQLLCLVSLVCCKGVQKSSAFTENMGQEVIEIGNPIKELPPGMEEEPSAENDEDFKPTTTTVQPATKKADLKKLTTSEARRKVKDVDKIDGVDASDEEAKIEKELSEIYKDNVGNDYSAEISQAMRQGYKPIERAGFKFQPDINNKAEVERFRTSIDEISCDRSVTQKLELFVPPSVDTPRPGAASSILTNMALILFLVTLTVIS